MRDRIPVRGRGKDRQLGRRLSDGRDDLKRGGLVNEVRAIDAEVLIVQERDARAAGLSRSAAAMALQRSAAAAAPSTEQVAPKQERHHTEGHGEAYAPRGAMPLLGAFV